MSLKYQCSNCNSKEYVDLDFDSQDYDVFQARNSDYILCNYITPHICLNCGTIFVDEYDLANIKEKLNEERL